MSKDKSSERDQFPVEILRVTQQTIQELRELCQQGKGTFVEADESLEGEDLDDYPEMHHITLRDGRQTVEFVIHPSGIIKIINQQIDNKKFSCDFSQRFEDAGEVSESVSLNLRDLESIPSFQAYEIEHVKGFLSEEDDYDQFHFELFFEFKDKFIVKWTGEIDRTTGNHRILRSYQLPGQDRTYSLDSSMVLAKIDRDSKTEIDEVKKRFEWFDIELLREGVLRILTKESIVSLRMERPKVGAILGMIRSFQREPDPKEDIIDLDIPPVPLVPFFIEEKKRK